MFNIADILEALAGFAACGIVGSFLKWYVDTYCRDNEPIVWIWLEDNEPEGGHFAGAFRFSYIFRKKLMKM